VALVALALPARAQTETQQPVSTPPTSGIFTNAQAARGKDAFDQSCGFCHGPHDLASAKFQNTWAGSPVERFYSFIRSNMPYDNPGRLSSDQYADIVAYVLQLNGFPTGPTELTPDSKALGVTELKFTTPAEP
jgi:mono/diheme cytochrome c family protein